MAYLASTPAFGDFQQNLGYARQLVEGGRLLSDLAVTSFDTEDLFRAAWVQAVAALDHWVHEEIYHRAVVIAQKRGGVKPRRFLEFDIPMELFENVSLGTMSLEAAFRGHLRKTLGWRSYQNPGKIREGFALVSDVQLWTKVAKILSDERADGEPITQKVVIDEMTRIAGRRNKISHEADRDPDRPGKKLGIGAEETRKVIDWLEGVAAAILVALDGPPKERSAADLRAQEADHEPEPELSTDLFHGEERYFQRLRHSSGEPVEHAVLMLLDWWRSRGGQVRYGRDGASCTPVIRRDGKTLNMVRFYPKTVEVPFGALKSRRPFDQPAFREELRQRLNEAPGVDIGSDKLDLYPSFPITLLLKAAVVSTVIDTLVWFTERVGDAGPTA
ncbi:hypothetical protein [Microbispora sp. NPDC049125]|uniref:hypothetical protein n=1 Tax=Microbispora sp. NPDC049125 TaxID=3154929 RepID=UPI0034667D38